MTAAAVDRPGEPLRRALHFSTIILPVLYAGWLDRGAMLALAGALVALSVLVELLRRGRGGATRFFDRTLGRAIRPEERRGLLGSTHLALGAAATLLIFPREGAVAGLLMLAVGDPVAAAAGRRLGRRRIGAKSLEGLLAFWVAASLALVLLWFWRSEFALRPMLVAAPVAAIAELLTPGRLDNWTVPLAAAATVTALS